MAWYHLDYSFILILTWISMQPYDTNSCKNVTGYSIQAPKRVTVQKGLCVHIPCHFTVSKDVNLSESTRGSWFKRADINRPPVATKQGNISQSTNGRFFLTGEVWKGDCSLSINDVMPADASFYMFRLRYSNKFSYCAIQPTVIVTAELTDKPEISQEKTLMAGEEVTLTCTSPGRCNGSAPLITWSGVQGKNITYQMDYLDGNKTYYSNITFIPSRVDHKSLLSCTVTFQRSNATTSQQISLNVEYPPYVNISIKGNTTTEDTRITVLEGDSLVIECIVDSNPQANISWHDKDSLLHGPLNGELLTYELRNITLNDAGRYQCSAQNNHWIRNRSIEVIVHYPPYINIAIKGNTTTEDTHITVLEGDSLVIKCIVDSNPQANISWHYKDIMRHGPVNGKLLSYELENITSSDAGRYQCSAQNNHWIRKRTIDIIVYYPPYINIAIKGNTTTEDTRITVLEGDSLVIKCIVDSNPQANISWHYKGIMRHGPLNGELLSYELENITSSDAGRYQCSAQNNHWIRKRTIDIIVYYKPRKMPCPSPCCLEQSKKIKCQCIIMAFPEAITQWKVNEESYPSSYNRNDLHITTDLYGSLSISTLEMNVNRGYRSSIQCSSSNQQGELVIKLLNDRRTLHNSYTTIILAIVFAILIIAVLPVKGLLLIQYYKKRKFKQMAENKTKCSTDCKENYCKTEVFFNEGYKPEGMPEKDRAPADEEDERYATVIFPQLKPRASVEEVETDYVCMDGSTAAVNGTSMPITFLEK